jgi:hypothetical protein
MLNRGYSSEAFFFGSSRLLSIENPLALQYYEPDTIIGC